MPELRLGLSWYRPRSQPGHFRHEVLLRQRPAWPVSGQHQAVRSCGPGLAGVLWGQHWAWFEVLRALEVLQAPGRLARRAARPVSPTAALCHCGTEGNGKTAIFRSPGAAPPTHRAPLTTRGK